VAKPGVTLRRTDPEADVPHAEPWVAAFLAVGTWPAPILRQEERQVPSRWTEVVWVERPQERISLHACVKTLYEQCEECVAADAFVQTITLSLQMDEHV
jgi:hypothetical protein